MHILQHKSWHVYSQKNQDKVKKDEAQAEAELAKVKERAETADREHRLALLRQRAQKRLANDAGPPELKQRVQDEAEDSTALVSAAEKPKTTHVNFWADLEKQDTRSSRGNPERELEKKAKEEKWNRTIAMHLDSGTRGPAPWYLAKHAGAMSASSQKNEKEYTKVREDPLQNVRTMLEKRERHHRSKLSSKTRKQEGKGKQKNDAQQAPSSMTTMEKLRMERLKREQAEKARAKDILNPTSDRDHDRPIGQYSQQFNPLATNSAGSARRRENFQFKRDIERKNPQSRSRPAKSSRHTPY